MGILRWGIDAAASAYADQPKEVLFAEGLNNDVLAVPATAKGKKGTPNVLTDGSVFNVGINQAALLIENGQVHDFVIADDEKMTGQYIYDTSREPSLLNGGTREWKNVWNLVKSRFQYGGHSPNRMQLVYINLKEITENPVGVGKVPFIDTYLGTRLLLGVHGYYTFRISNPAAFYENLLMDPSKKYRKEEITEQLRVEMMPKISGALTRIAPACVNGYQDIYVHDTDLANALNEALGKEWLDKRGIELVKVALNPEVAPADLERVMQLENARTLSNSQMAFGSMVNAQNNAMQNAAANANGAVNGFMGMNMAGGNSQTASLLAQKMEQEKAAQEAAAKAAAAPAPSSDSQTWVCANCGETATGRFCANCGTSKPEVKFCPNCGAKTTPGSKFCTNCGPKLS